MALLPPSLVKELAFKKDYRELDVSLNDRKHLLMFSHPHKKGCGGTVKESGPVKICVYYTTGKVSTSLEHPKAGKGQLQRTVADMSMLAMVFDNPRVHSNTGYHKREETRQRHRENGLNCRRVVQLACEKYKCAQAPGKPQDRNKLVIFMHPTGVRIRVWLNSGTVGLMKKGMKEVYVKKVSMSNIETYLDNPLKAVEDEKPSDDKLTHHEPSHDEPYADNLFYRPPLVNIDQYQATASTAPPPASPSTATSPSTRTDSRPVSRVDRSLIVSLACQLGFSKTCDQNIMIQFKNETKTASVNVYTTKGTVMLQGKGGLKETKKSCTVAGFMELLGKVKNVSKDKPQFVTSLHKDSDHAAMEGIEDNETASMRDSENAAKEGTDRNETPLIRAIRKAAENASMLCKN